MGITPRFTQTDIEKLLAEKMQLIEKAIIRRLKYLGEQCVNIARTSGSYTDQTGNLRNSIGYVILANGHIIHSDFRKSAKVTKVTSTGNTKVTTGAKDGVKAGSDLAEAVAKEYPEGYAVIVVAGMTYASAVESRGKDVLSTAEKYAEQYLPEMLKQLKENIGKMK